jgi:Fic family protein
LTKTPLFDKIGVMANDLLNHQFPPDLDSIWDKDFAIQLAATQGAISGLNQAVPLLHNPELLKQPLLDKEAESSSRLEGTQASAEDVYKAELKNDPEKSVEMIKSQPLNQVVIRQIHQILMDGARGQTKSPGKYRTGNVWIGARGTGLDKARYIPPDALHIPELIVKLEAFVNDSSVHPLIACGVIHHRFEAIHPFEDGNGRTGRLVVTLYLLKTGMLAAPILYPSGFFEKNRSDYMDALHAVDTRQDWYGWLMFFLRGIQTQAEQSLRVARAIDNLFKQNRASIKDATAHLNLLRVLEYCFTQPFVSVRLISDRLSIPPQTVRRYVSTLEDKGILRVSETLERGEKVYENHALLEILRQI